MTVELNPVGVACNLGCTYCYEDPMRDAGNVNKRWNWEAAKAAILEEGTDFIIFGGEPLLISLDKLEMILKFGYERFGKTGLQTNGTLVTDEHLELFKRYNSHVGVSFDGPGKLSLSRWVEDENTTLEMADKTERTINTLLDRGIPTSLIVTLWKGNSEHDQDFQNLIDWFKLLDAKGMSFMRLHLLEVDSERAVKMRVDEGILIRRLKFLAEEELTYNNLKFDLFTEMRKLLLGATDGSCVWQGCDPYTTPAVQGVDGDGTRSNCGRTNKDGVNWLKSDVPSKIRLAALYNTPHKYGGCKDCRFFFACKGYCPGTAIDGDWRNRTEHCNVLFAMFEHFEARVSMPLSLSPNLADIESHIIENVNHSDVSHVDTPHGDMHLDSNSIRRLEGSIPCFPSDTH